MNDNMEITAPKDAKMAAERIVRMATTQSDVEQRDLMKDVV